jgi:hypothetical protein
MLRVSTSCKTKLGGLFEFETDNPIIRSSSIRILEDCAELFAIPPNLLFPRAGGDCPLSHTPARGMTSYCMKETNSDRSA